MQRCSAVHALIDRCSPQPMDVPRGPAEAARPQVLCDHNQCICAADGRSCAYGGRRGAAARDHISYRVHCCCLYYSRMSPDRLWAMYGALVYSCRLTQGGIRDRSADTGFVPLPAIVVPCTYARTRSASSRAREELSSTKTLRSTTPALALLTASVPPPQCAAVCMGEASSRQKPHAEVVRGLRMYSTFAHRWSTLLSSMLQDVLQAAPADTADSTPRITLPQI